MQQEEAKGALIYTAVIATKADASMAVKEMLAQVHDDHGHMPHTVCFRLLSDSGMFIPRGTKPHPNKNRNKSTERGAGYDVLFWL